MSSVRPSLTVFLLALASVWTGVPVIAAEDDYLSAIEAESKKIDARGIDAREIDGRENVDSPGSTDAGVSGDAEAGVAGEGVEKRNEFEAILAEKYHGSFIFYRKLPEHSRQEIIEEYQRGTSFVKIRKKIVDRFMQR